MSDDPVLAAVQKFMDAVEERMSARESEIRGLLEELQTRATPQVIQGPPGPKGDTGERGIDGKNGIDGRDGKDGAPGIGEKGERGADGLNGKDSTVPGPKGDTGQRGADGIATREEIESIIELRFADLQVRSLADTWRGVWKPGETYMRGAVAQWDGSPWLALKDSTDIKPGTSAIYWNLFAKKGRDGR